LNAGKVMGLQWSLADLAGDVFGTPAEGAAYGLRLLAYLRIWAPIAQAVTLFVVIDLYGVQMPLAPIVVLLAVEVLLAVATWVYLRNKRQVSAMELTLQAHVDIVLFAVMLYLTGGATNPFAPLFVVPMAVVASTLSQRHVWITAISTMLAYALLRFYHVRLHHPDGQTEVYELHENGMVVNYLFTAALLAIFCSRMRAALSRHERRLADARDAQMRDESVVAIGALAAGYAHELSSPLSAVAVVVDELRRERATDDKLQQDLRIIEGQVGACKQIISNLANAGGQRRAESAGVARLDQFIASIIDKARSLHPQATINVSLDTTTPPPFIAAEETLRQAIANLIANAARASPCQVEVGADWSGAELLVVVRDRGPGFDAEMLRRFSAPIRPRPSEHGGMGVGLMLSAATLQRLGGRLKLSNEPGGGARAEIHLPLKSITIESRRPVHDVHQPV